MAAAVEITVSHHWQEAAASSRVNVRRLTLPITAPSCPIDWLIAMEADASVGGQLSFATESITLDYRG